MKTFIPSLYPGSKTCFRILLVCVFILLANADKYYYSNNNNNTKFNNILTIDFPVGIWINEYTQIVPINITYNAEIRNNFSDVYTVTIPFVMWGQMYIGHSGGTYNGFDDPYINLISFKSHGESYINYTVEVDCYNRTWWTPEKNSDDDDDSDIIIICSVLGAFVVLAILIFVCMFYFQYKKNHKRCVATTEHQTSNINNNWIPSAPIAINHSETNRLIPQV